MLISEELELVVAYRRLSIADFQGNDFMGGQNPRCTEQRGGARNRLLETQM